MAHNKSFTNVSPLTALQMTDEERKAEAKRAVDFFEYLTWADVADREYHLHQLYLLAPDVWGIVKQGLLYDRLYQNLCRCMHQHVEDIVAYLDHEEPESDDEAPCLAAPTDDYPLNPNSYATRLD